MKHFGFLFLALSLCISTLSYGQKEKRIPKHRSKFVIGLSASPDLYMYDFKVDTLYRLSYKSDFNYSLGVTAIYQPVKFVSFRFGVVYSTKGFTVNYKYAVENPASYLPKKSDLSVSYLDIPLTLNFNLIHRDRVQLFISTGVVPGVLLDKAEKTFFNDSTGTSSNTFDEKFNVLLAGTSCSLGFKYNFSPSFGLGAEPYFRYYLNKIDVRSMKDHPISVGGKFTVYINFQNKHNRDKAFGTL